MAISAATPACKGYLCDTDCRWNFITDATDDRTKEERGLEVITSTYLYFVFNSVMVLLQPLRNDRFVIPKSRWSSIPCYIHQTSGPYNDEKLPLDEETKKTLQAQGFATVVLHTLC